MPARVGALWQPGGHVLFPHPKRSHPRPVDCRLAVANAADRHRAPTNRSAVKHYPIAAKPEALRPPGPGHHVAVLDPAANEQLKVVAQRHEGAAARAGLWDPSQRVCVAHHAGGS